MTSCTKRLRRELQAVRKEPDPSILLAPDPDNIRLWDAFIQGPPSTPYADKIFQLKVNVGADYPLSSPVISFVTKIFHPNVHFAVCGPPPKMHALRVVPCSKLDERPEERRVGKECVSRCRSR